MNRSPGGAAGGRAAARATAVSAPSKVWSSGRPEARPEVCVRSWATVTAPRPRLSKPGTRPATRSRSRSRPSSTSIMTLVVVATTLVRDARSNTVSVVIGSGGSAARDRAPNAHRSNKGCPMVCTRTQPSRVRWVSDGADTWLRFSEATRSGARTACSMRAALATVRVAPSSDPRTLLAPAGPLARQERGQRAGAGRERGREVDPGHVALGGLARLPREIHGPRHRLADAVEADPVRVRPARAERRHAGQHDAGVDRRERRLVEPQGAQSRIGQVGDDHVRPRRQPPQHRAPLGLHRVQGHPALVAVDLHEERAVAGRGQRHQETVFAAADLLDPHHVGPQVREQRRAERPRDVAAEIEHPDPVENPGHRQPRLPWNAPARIRTAQAGERSSLRPEPVSRRRRWFWPHARTKGPHRRPTSPFTDSASAGAS